MGNFIFDILAQICTNKFLYLIFIIFMVFAPIYAIYIIRKQLSKSQSLQKHITISIISVTAIFFICIPLIFHGVRTAFSLIHNENIQKALQDSSLLMDAYNKDNKEKITKNITHFSRIINDATLNNIYNQASIQVLIEGFAALYALSETVIFIPSKNLILAKNDSSFSLNFDYLPVRTIEEANREQPLVLENMNLGEIRALIELKNFPYKTYLMIVRHIDPQMTEYFNSTKTALNSYEKFSSEIQKMQNISLTIFIAVFLIALLTMRIMTSALTKRITEPIDNFVKTVSNENMKIEDFNTLNSQTNISELNILIDAFYTKIRQLEAHTNLNQEIFKQTSSGFIVIDMLGRIIMQNQTAIDLLKSNNSTRMKEEFFAQIREATDQMIKTNAKDGASVEKGIVILTGDSKNNNVKHEHLLAHIVKAKFTAHADATFLIVFNNISDHVSYQRSLLWIDIAKRITHEIRNPLTPIMLSAERLEYKFSKLIENENDKSDFLKYLDNIKKHTNTISTIIDEFVEFGRMPEPKFEKIDLVHVIQETINGSYFDKEMHYELNVKPYNDCETSHNNDSKDSTDVLVKNAIYINADEKQIMRMLLNIFKNAYEALVGTNDNNKKYKKLIKVNLYQIPETSRVVILIEDFGPGFPEQLIDKIAEPYVTTKTKGSGLGLSIVKKIIEDHGGKMHFSNKPKNDQSSGAIIKIELMMCA